jgi:hypothetical protein
MAQVQEVTPFPRIGSYLPHGSNRRLAMQTIRKRREHGTERDSPETDRCDPGHTRSDTAAGAFLNAPCKIRFSNVCENRVGVPDPKQYAGNGASSRDDADGQTRNAGVQAPATPYYSAPSSGCNS